MLMTDYTSKLLNLEDVIITNVENNSNQLHIYIELPRSNHLCPACGTITDRVHDYRMQTIKDVPLARDTFLHLRKRRYRCVCGKRFFEKNTFLPRYYRVTSRLVAEIIFAFKKITSARDNYTAMLLVCDPSAGTPQEFYSVKGSLGGKLSLSDSGKLLWDVESITTTFFSPATSSFTIGGTSYVFRYTFDNAGMLVSQEKTGEITVYRR